LSTDLEGITFLDVEATRGGRVLQVGAVRGARELRLELDTGRRPGASKAARAELEALLGERHGAIGGHNLIEFDLPRLMAPPLELAIGERPIVDTLVLSMLADPTRRSHALDKSLARLAGGVPDPVADARLSREVARGALDALAVLDPGLARLCAALLRAGGHAASAALLEATVGIERDGGPLTELAAGLPESALGRLCRVNLGRLVASLDAARRPGELVGLALALRFVLQGSAVRNDAAKSPTGDDEASGVREARLTGVASAALGAIPRFGEMVARLLGPLCADPSCEARLRCDVHRPFAEEILARHFELGAFRPHQKEIVLAVLEGKTPLAVLPTGGGKSLCYQLPAVHGATRLRGLTVVISPLQALMADQVRALSTRYPGVCYVNASLLLADRRENLEEVRIGKSDILYIGPEQLRNPGIVRLLRNRPPFLWVIDEAHCISQWGHGFRTDYTYLPRAIAQIHGPGRRPLVALFTATAAASVIDDIRDQIRRGLGIEVELIKPALRRDNLAFEVIPVSDEAAKDRELENLLNSVTGGSRLIYRSTVRGARELAAKLRERGVPCALYHGKLPGKEKAEQLEQFLSGGARTVVATSAFGMGIDKSDIRLVVHYDLPGSVEDYVQEAGRAGRDGKPARCVLLYSEDDLETQFYLKSASRVMPRDVRFLFSALRARARRLPRGDDGKVELWVSPEELFVDEQLEDALDWSREELGTKIKLVLYQLEADGVLERLENRTRVFSLTARAESLDAARARLPSPASPATLRVLEFVYDPERPRMVSILDVADASGLSPRDAFREVQALTDLGLVGQELAFDVMLARGVPHSSADLAQRWLSLTEHLLALGTDLDDSPVIELRSSAAELARRSGRPVAPHELFQILRGLRRLGLVRLDKVGPSRFRVRFDPSFVAARAHFRDVARTADALLGWIDRQLEGKRGRDVPFALDVERFVGEDRRLDQTFTSAGVVEACLLLHHLEVWHLSDPPVLFDVAMKVRFDPRKRLEDLRPERTLRQHEHEVSLVHLLREYAIRPAGERARYLEDYFELPRPKLLERWFKHRKKAILRPVGPRTEAELLAGLTDAQRDAVSAEDEALLVVAGPGSGKTHTVVRRIAHMVRARQVRPSEILVLAFSRAAVAELRTRLDSALGERARFVDVRTFHSLALRLTGDDLRDDAADSEERLGRAMARAAELLGGKSRTDDGAGDEPAADPAETRRRALGPVRHVLVDEYQDLDPDQYALLTALVGLAREAPKRDRVERSVLVVGDDDQALYGFRNASIEFLRRFEQEFSARRICLVDNFRSVARITSAGARFIERLPDRIKQDACEQMRAAPGIEEGGEQALRRFRYPGPYELSAHAAYAVSRSLEQGQGSIAVLARHWSLLDGVRALLEDAGIPFVLHHREFHRAAHRRHPGARVIRELWRRREPVVGRAGDMIRALALSWGRGFDEPSLAELLRAADEIDAERARSASRLETLSAPVSETAAVLAVSDAARPEPARAEQPELAPLTTIELADSLLLASRDAALRGGAAMQGARVHLATFHAAKGLEFDKVIVLPAQRGDHDEQRAYYVAITRARRGLVIASYGGGDELGSEIECPTRDLSQQARKLPGARVAYLDCTPKHVRLGSPALAGAQRRIDKLREGEPLAPDPSGKRLRLLSGGKLVCELSVAGQEKLDKLCARVGDPVITARVHELYVHLLRTAPSAPATGFLLAVLPTLRISDRTG
jgi:ATP-dependent DNA helicase RecQ